jgi:hypothetical protein
LNLLISLKDHVLALSIGESLWLSQTLVFSKETWGFFSEHFIL